MHPTFRAFKRHYHKVRKLVPKLSESGSFHLEISLDGNSVQAKHSTPDEENTVRFVVLMRRFLDPSDVLYYEKVWSFLQKDFAEELSHKIVEAVESLIQQLRTGTIGIRINNEQLTAEQVYRTLADGAYFGRDEKAQEYLNSLAGLPIVGPLFWNEFYTYTLTGFVLASKIFDAMSEVERSEKYNSLYVAPVAAKRCIYCTTTTGDFTSEEHIFPESLGNDELILPRGYVCDACNHRVLSTLDATLLEFDPIAFLRVQFVSYTKKGKLPKAKFQNVRMERTHPQHIRITAQDKTGLPQNKRELGDGWISFNLAVRGNKFNPKALARSLYKVGLGLVALGQGVEVACDSKYDQARSFIAEGQGFPNNLLMCMNCVPTPQVIASYRDMSPGTPVAMSIYGLIFLFNLETTPTVDLNNQLAQLYFQSFSLDDQVQTTGGGG